MHATHPSTPESSTSIPSNWCYQSWKLICVPADQIESPDSKWLNSEPRINIAGKNEDGESYEVVIEASCVQYLFISGCEQYLNYDPTAPETDDIERLGIQEATKRRQARFLRNAASRARSCRGYEECCRDYARLNRLGIQLERALLTYDILKSHPRTCKRFAQYLQFLALNSLWNYNCPEALELLAKDQTNLLQPFQKCRADPFKTLAEPRTPIKTFHDSEAQIIHLVQALLEFSSGMVDSRQRAFNQEYTISDNFNLYKTLMGVTGTNWFGNFDPNKMYNALLKSKVFTKDADVGTLNIMGWTEQMMGSLPIGFPEGHLNLPSQVLRGLSARQVMSIHIYLEHNYHHRPSLRKPENNVLLFLTFISTSHNLPLQVLSNWASLRDTLKLCQRLLRDFQSSQEPEQLVLTLAALLCHGRFLPHTSNDTAQTISGCYLTDLDFLLSGRSLSNQRIVLERVGFSFLRVLTAVGDECEDLIRLLAGALDKDPPIQDPFDGLTDRYVVERIKNKLPHLETMLKFGYLEGSKVSDADTAELGADSSWVDEDFSECEGF